jgi:hypothetical protein
MAIEYTKADYTTPKQILVFPEHYVAVAHTFLVDDSAAVTVGGRDIIKAGTIYPANTNAAIGVVFNDMDITDGDKTGALIVHGFIKTAALPALPSSDAKAALKQISFLPLEAVSTTITIEGAGIQIEVGEAAGKFHVIRVEIEGARFRPAAATLTNWTITGEADTKVAVDNIVVADNGRYVDITTKNSATAAAGAVTVVPKTAATSTGDVPAAATTIVTVAAAAAAAAVE